MWPASRHGWEGPAGRRSRVEGGPRLSSLGIRLRSTATVAVLVAMAAGTFLGGDDHFPFGPFRMYSTRTAPTGGTVTVTRFEGTTVSGDVVRLEPGDFGLRRAEVLGQIPRIRQQPALLEHLAHAYQRWSPEEPSLVELELVQGTYHLAGGRSTRYDERVLAEWRRR